MAMFQSALYSSQLFIQEKQGQAFLLLPIYYMKPIVVTLKKENLTAFKHIQVNNISGGHR